jgi:hypothetical protein
MSALPVSGIIFILTSGGILLGALLRRTLPKHHLNERAAHQSRGRCVYRKLDSAISVVKSTEYGPRRDDAKALDQPMNGSVLVQ